MGLGTGKKHCVADVLAAIEKERKGSGTHGPDLVTCPGTEIPGLARRSLKRFQTN